MIRSLTDWVVRTAVRQAAIWQSHRLDLRIAVNLSMRNLLADMIAEQLRRWSVSLDIEIKKSALMADLDRAYGQLRFG